MFSLLKSSYGKDKSVSIKMRAEIKSTLEKKVSTALGVTESPSAGDFLAYSQVSLNTVMGGVGNPAPSTQHPALADPLFSSPLPVTGVASWSPPHPPHHDPLTRRKPNSRTHLLPPCPPFTGIQEVSKMPKDLGSNPSTATAYLVPLNQYPLPLLPWKTG